MFGTLQLGLGLTSRQGGGLPWNPNWLFQSGDILLWYDPSDLTTMFTNTTGTTQVAADGDSVALMLDKGQWGGKTLEQVRDNQENVWPQSSAAWASLNTGVTANAAVVTVNRTAGETVGSVATSGAVLPTIAGYVSYWEVTISDFVFAETASLRIGGSGTASVVKSITGNGTFSGYSYASQASGTINVVAGGGDFKITATVKLIPGYHRTQATGTSMPKYKTDGTLHWLLYDGTDDGHATGTIPFNTVTSDGTARRNLLTEPDKFDHSTWLKLSGGTGVAPVVTANAGIAPDGTTTADRVVFDRGAGTTASDLSRLFQAYTSSNVCINTFYAKAYDGISSFDLQITNGSGTDVVTVTGEWQRFSVVSINSTVNFQIRVAGDTTQQTADVLLWGAQGELGSTATDFQNIGTDEVAVCAGVTKSSDAASGIVVEFGNFDTTNGCWYLLAPGSNGVNSYRFCARGTGNTANGTLNVASTFSAPHTAVLTCLSDLPADSNKIRVNGTQDAQNSADLGAGNFSNSILYFGRRGGVSAPFNGREYQTVIRSRLLSTAELSSLETFIAAKTGVIL